MFLQLVIPVFSSGMWVVNFAQTTQPNQFYHYLAKSEENPESSSEDIFGKKDVQIVKSYLVKRPYSKVVSISAPTSYEISSPIIINNNTGFDAFPGDGSPTKPYSIDNKNITDPTKILIDIRNTDVYFNITNCLLQYGTRGIYLENVSHGYIYNNIIFNNTYGIVLQSNSSNNIISSNLVNITRMEMGIKLEQTENIHIISNIVCNASSEGVAISKSRNCTISDNSIYNNGYRAGLDIDDSSNCTFTDNVIYNNYYGIYSIISENNLIMNNIIFNNDRNGIAMGQSKYCTLSNLTIYNNMEDGFYLWSCANCVMENVNSTENNQYEYSSDQANYISDSGNSTFSNIICFKNDGDGIYFDECRNSTFSKITCFENIGSGLSIRSSGNSVLSDIVTFDNYGNGLYLDDCNHTLIHNIKTTGNKYSGLIIYGYSGPYNYTITNINSSFNHGLGIYFNNIQNSTISNSDIYNNDRNGIEIDNSPYITIVSNNIFNNGNRSYWGNDYGIYLHSGSNECNLTSNSVFSNEFGISIDNVNDSTITSNMIYNNNETGIDISYSAGNIISNNIVYYNREYGISGHYSIESGNLVLENNIINLNDFIGNSYLWGEFYEDKFYQAHCDGPSYQFDHNFWDNYRFPDENNDNIVDYKLKVGTVQYGYEEEYNYDENPHTTPCNDYSSIHYLTSPIITFPTNWDPTNPEEWGQTKINHTVTIQWLESLDTKDHKVTYSLYYLQVGGGWDEQNWTEITSELSTTSYDWDTTNLIDGYYYLMINVTCSHGLISSYREERGEFYIDNSPPLITDAYASYSPFVLILISVITIGTIKRYKKKL
ncbi:MAG: nitrous oxide reductase family maturation protein NosD [Promethearchaeota archaeon]